MRDEISEEDLERYEYFNSLTDKDYDIDPPAPPFRERYPDTSFDYYEVGYIRPDQPRESLGWFCAWSADQAKWLAHTILGAAYPLEILRQSEEPPKRPMPAPQAPEERYFTLDDLPPR